MSSNLIFKDKKFAPLFWTQFLGALNDNFFKNSLVMLITYKAVSLLGLGSSLLVPAAGGIFILPFFLFSATAGQIADKFDKSKVIQVTKVTELIIMCLAAIGLYLNSFGWLFFVLFLMGAQSAFFGPLKYGIIPSLVSRDLLVAGNAFVSSGTFIAILIGTILGGTFVGFYSYVSVISVGLILVSIAGLVASFKMVKIPGKDESIKVDLTFIRPTWNILKMTTRNKEIFFTILGVSWFWFLGAAILSLLPVFVKNVLFGGAEVATLFLAFFTIGMGIGSFLTERISGKQIEIGVVPISALGMSLFLIDLSYVGTHWGNIPNEGLFSLSEFLQLEGSFRALGDLLIISIFGGGYIVPQMSYVQFLSNPSELSRTIAGNNIWNALFMVVSSIVIMVLNGIFTISQTFLIVSLANVVISFFLYAIHSKNTLRMWMKFISKVFYKVEVEGLENIPENGSFIVASNHVSFVDWVFLMGLVDRPVHFVIDWNYYYAPMGPFWFKQAGLIPIATRKESPEVLAKAFSRIQDNINKGHVLGVFPEGWITRDGKMRKFQPGIQKISKENNVPIVLFAIDGLWGSMFSFKNGRVLLKFPERISLGRRPVKIKISRPISPSEYNSQNAQDWMRNNVSHYTEECTNSEPREENGILNS